MEQVAGFSVFFELPGIYHVVYIIVMLFNLTSNKTVIAFTIIWRCYQLYASLEPWHNAHHICVFDGIVDIDNHRNTEVSSVVEIVTCSKTSGSVLTVRRCYSPTHAYILCTHSSLACMCVLCGGIHREKVST